MGNNNKLLILPSTRHVSGPENIEKRHVSGPHCSLNYCNSGGMSYSDLTSNDESVIEVHFLYIKRGK